MSPHSGKLGFLQAGRTQCLAPQPEQLRWSVCCPGPQLWAGAKVTVGFSEDESCCLTGVSLAVGSKCVSLTYPEIL